MAQRKIHQTDRRYVHLGSLVFSRNLLIVFLSYIYICIYIHLLYWCHDAHIQVKVQTKCSVWRFIERNCCCTFKNRNYRIEHKQILEAVHPIHTSSHIVRLTCCWGNKTKIKTSAEQRKIQIFTFLKSASSFVVVNIYMQPTGSMLPRRQNRETESVLNVLMFTATRSVFKILKCCFVSGAGSRGLWTCQTFFFSPNDSFTSHRPCALRV